MNSVDRNIVLNGLYHHPFHIVAASQAFQSLKHYWVMSNDQVAALFNCLFHNRFRRVQATKHGFHFCTLVAGDQPGIIVASLIG